MADHMRQIWLLVCGGVQDVSHRSSRCSLYKRIGTENIREGFMLDFGASLHVLTALLDEKPADHLPGCGAQSIILTYPGQQVLRTVSLGAFCCCSVYWLSSCRIII